MTDNVQDLSEAKIREIQRAQTDIRDAISQLEEQIASLRDEIGRVATTAYRTSLRQESQTNEQVRVARVLGELVEKISEIDEKITNTKS